AMGVNTALYKSLTFGVSAAYTGVAGGLSALVIAFVAPDAFNVFLSITFLVGIVIGGLASISGALFGALFIQFVPNWAQDISKAAPWAIYGVFLILFMYVMPRGIAGAVRLVLALGAYFKKVNEEGGVNGRKINYVTYDDAYSPPKTVEMVRKLVEQDQVALLFQTLGTPTNTAIHKYMNQQKVPHIFVATGATKW